MRSFKRSRLLRAANGQSMTEYMLILSAVAIAVMSGYRALGAIFLALINAICGDI